MRTTSVILSILALGFICSCSKKNDVSADKAEDSKTKPVVYTTFYPTKYFTERIAGHLAETVCPVPDEEDAIFWMPGAEIIAEYQKADLIVVNGAGFEKWIQKVSLPGDRIVDTAKPLKESFINYEEATTHSHGKGGEHAHEGLDGHTWVDPINAGIQANEIKKALVKILPEHKESLERNYKALTGDIATLNSKLEKFRNNTTPLLASHPAYNYLVRSLGWNVKNLDLDPEEMPSDESIKEIRDILKEHPAKTLIWEGAPTAEIAERLQKELGVSSVVFSPCELLAKEDIASGKNYISVMTENIRNITQAFDTK